MSKVLLPMVGCLGLYVGLTVCAVPALAQPSSADSATHREDRVDQWIADLDSDRFAVRNAAARELLDAGAAAIPALADSLEGAGAERTWRILQILTVHCRYGQPELAASALAALEKITSSSNGSAARSATAALDDYRAFRHRQAVLALRALGANVSDRGTEAPEVRIDKRWQGADEDLAHLLQVHGLRMVAVSDSTVGDEGLKHLGTLADLERLFLGESKVRGPGLEYLTGLSRLQYLSLKGLPLDDRAVAPLGELKQLNSLGMDDTPITDAALEHLKPLANLQTLWLNRTRVTDAGLVHLETLVRLDRLYLSGLKLKGQGLESLARLPNLRYLSLQYTPITDEGLKHVSDLTQIELLGLDDTQVTDAGLAHLEPLVNLQHLWLTNTQVGDASIPRLKGLQNLTRLEVRGCKFTPQGLAELQAALPNCRIVH